MYIFRRSKKQNLRGDISSVVRICNNKIKQKILLQPYSCQNMWFFQFCELFAFFRYTVQQISYIHYFLALRNLEITQTKSYSYMCMYGKLIRHQLMHQRTESESQKKKEPSTTISVQLCRNFAMFHKSNFKSIRKGRAYSN